MLQCNTSGIYQWTPSITDHGAVATLVTRIVSIMPAITSHLLAAQGGQSCIVPGLVPGLDLGLTKAPHLPRPELTWPVLAAAWPSIAPSLLSWSQQLAASSPAQQRSDTISTALQNAGIGKNWLRSWAGLCPSLRARLGISCQVRRFCNIFPNLYCIDITGY